MKTLLSDIVYTPKTVLQMTNSRGVFRFTIEKESPTSKDVSVFVASVINRAPLRWVVKQLPLETVKKQWDDVIEVAIDAVLKTGTLVTKPEVIKRIVPGDKDVMNSYDVVITMPKTERKYISKALNPAV